MAPLKETTVEYYEHGQLPYVLKSAHEKRMAEIRELAFLIRERSRKSGKAPDETIYAAACNITDATTNL